MIDPATSESHRREETEETTEDRVTGGRPVLWLLVTGNRVAVALLGLSVAFVGIVIIGRWGPATW